MYKENIQKKEKQQEFSVYISKPHLRKLRAFTKNPLTSKPKT